MLKNARDWKTTVAGVIAGALVIAGVLYPDKFDPETQATVNAAAAQIMTGAGALIAVISGLLAKD